MEHVPIFKEDMKNGVVIVDVIDPYNYTILGKCFVERESILVALETAYDILLG